ncbi:DUF2798 domain-containing protein [Desulfurispira natronophila]|uniref:DUF2798 domain-containing protein n=1 Tax=Desulfurispira natronophila TaxID=682562 RepID=A0A7W8DHI4_9BACT|nr:DUF2798 domain-containing protein [Desulfurispira natronophila]MBB5022515.1 hypothetical protein [Desulfurispira natronophila]
MIPRKYEFFLFTFFMALFMSIFMSGVISLINVGWVDNFGRIWAEAFIKAFIVAYPTIMVVVPQVRRIVKFLIRD